MLECILYLSPAIPVVRDITALDTLLRIRELATRSGLDAKAIIQLGALTPDSDTQAYREAAEHVLASLSESTIERLSQEFGEVGQSVTHEIRCINDTLIANVSDQVALVELTLRDLAGRVLPNITVMWSSDRPGLLEDVSITDHEGRAVIRFKPEKGPWMGAVQIKGTYGLAQVVHAPKIIVDCDEFSLGFATDRTQPPTDSFLAGGEAFFEVYVRLVDLHGNPGRGRTVTFAGQGVVADPLISITDDDGYARTKVSSIEPVQKAGLIASYSTKDSAVISNITFVDNPSIKLLELVSMAVVGHPLKFRCHVIGLAKLPSPGVQVELYSGAGIQPIETLTTDEDGMVEFTVATPEAGKQTYTAKVAMDEQALEIDVAENAVIHGESSDFLYPVAGAGTPTLLWVTVRDAANNQARLIANCPIIWRVVGPGGFEVLSPVTVSTDALGRSTYPFEVDIKGEYEVTAERQAQPQDKRTFTLKVAPPIEWKFTLTDKDTQVAVSRATARDPLKLIRGHQYTLEIGWADLDLEGARAMLAWTSEFSAKGLGLMFDPPTGAYVEIGDDTKLSWEIDCNDLRNGTFDLTFYCNRLDQRLILPGRLDAPPPVVLHPTDGAQNVEVQPLLSGTGSPSAQVYVFEGREGALLARTSVRDDGTWSVRFAEPLSAGPHVFSVKQRHIDTTEAWAEDVAVTVDADFVAQVQILSPLSGSTVRVESWVEGLGMPGVELRIVKAQVESTIYAQVRVGADGRWRTQFTPELTPGADQNLNAAFYVDDVRKSAWLSTAYRLTVVARNQ